MEKEKKGEKKGARTYFGKKITRYGVRNREIGGNRRIPGILIAKNKRIGNINTNGPIILN